MQAFHAAVLLLLINFAKTLCPQAEDSELFCQCYDEFAMIYLYEENGRKKTGVHLLNSVKEIVTHLSSCL